MHAPAAPAGVGSAAPPARVCAQCGAEGIWQCVKCKKAVYCSRKCQKRHWWANHKGRCFAPEERKAFNTPGNRKRLSMAAFHGDAAAALDLTVRGADVDCRETQHRAYIGIPSGLTENRQGAAVRCYL